MIMYIKENGHSAKSCDLANFSNDAAATKGTRSLENLSTLTFLRIHTKYERKFVNSFQKKQSIYVSFFPVVERVLFL